MGSDMYRQQILDHYKNPRNYGELPDATFAHEGHNSSCGDDIRVEVTLAEDGEIVDRAAFTGEGCAISQASASMLTEELPGMTIDEVLDLDRDDVLDLLGVEVTPMRVKCAVRIYRGELEDAETSTE
jgi:nitrogen fixation NifU-like protein